MRSCGDVALVALSPAGAHQVVMVGSVEPAFGCSLVGERLAHQHQCRAGDMRLFSFFANVAKGAADQLLVRPADAIGDDCGALGTIEGYQRANDTREVGDREVD